jgi:ferrous iron transport protein A
MLPLTFADVDKEVTVQLVKGNPEVKKHLEDLGFVVGGTVRVVSKNGDNLIVNVKETRLGLDKSMANKIMI